ncbi:MAG: 4Fe-4S double cluster binding domain-containing protein [Thermoplasmatota archaeon]
MGKEVKLKQYALQLGADLFGIADLNLLNDVKTLPDNLLEGYTRGISIGVDLGKSVFKNLPESRPIYADIYRIANRKLDYIAYHLYKKIKNLGYEAITIPASKVLKDTHYRSFISHKSIARAAGLGWIGKSLLLVTKEYGPRVRLASILTDMELETGNPIKNKCGNCTSCIDNCIANALKDHDFQEYPTSRENCLDTNKCADKLKKFEEDPDVGEMICGICIKVCPYTKS